MNCKNIEGKETLTIQVETRSKLVIKADATSTRGFFNCGNKKELDFIVEKVEVLILDSWLA